MDSIDAKGVGTFDTVLQQGCCPVPIWQSPAIFLQRSIFGRRHLWGRETGKCWGTDPEENETQPDDVLEGCHWVDGIAFAEARKGCQSQPQASALRP
jgi:hypothetical protein